MISDCCYILLWCLVALVFSQNFNERNEMSIAYLIGVEHHFRGYHIIFNVPLIITQCSNNFSCYQFTKKFIPLNINNILNNGHMTVDGKCRNLRNGKCVKEHVYNFNIRRIKMELFGRPQYTLALALKIIVRWYLANMKWLANLPFGKYEKHSEKNLALKFDLRRNLSLIGNILPRHV